MDSFKEKWQRDNHYKFCVASKTTGQIERFCPPGSTMKFVSPNKRYPRQLIGTFDFEAVLEKPELDDDGNEKEIVTPCGGKCGRTL